MKSTSTGAETSAASSFNPTLEPGLASIDSTAAQSMRDLQWVHQARLAGLTRTAAALKLKYGSADSRVSAADAAVAATTLAVRRIAMVNLQQNTPAPTVSAGGWVQHGRIFMSDLNPAADLTVFLVDANKTYQQQYGFAYTDNTGYFLLQHAGADTKAKAVPLFVQVANRKGQPIHLETTPIQPALGGAAYLNVTLSATTSPLGDPPAAIRRTAFPNLKRRRDSAK